MDLKDLRDYWMNKYPNVGVRLWEGSNKEKYFGVMWTQNSCQDLSATTIGELINKGESYLRKVVK